MSLEAWSWSRYECWYQCPYKFKLKFVEKHPCMEVQQSDAMRKGREKHLDLAKYLLTPPDVNMPVPEFVTLPFQRQLYADMRSHDNKLVEQQWGFTSKWEKTGYFSRNPHKPTWFRAILDAALLYDDRVGEAVDHKTGKVYGENAEQMELFALSFMCEFPYVVEVITRLVYIDAKTEQIATYPTKDVDLLKRKWEGKVAPMFADTTYMPRPNDKCRFCEGARSNGGPCRFG